MIMIVNISNIERLIIAPRFKVSLPVVVIVNWPILCKILNTMHFAGLQTNAIILH